MNWKIVFTVGSIISGVALIATGQYIEGTGLILTALGINSKSVEEKEGKK